MRYGTKRQECGKSCWPGSERAATLRCERNLLPGKREEELGREGRCESRVKYRIRMSGTSGWGNQAGLEISLLSDPLPALSGRQSR